MLLLQNTRMYQRVVVLWVKPDIKALDSVINLTQQR